MTGPDVLVVALVAILAFALGWTVRPHLPVGAARRHPAHHRTGGPRA